jgi:hypothetical protein
MPAHPHTGPGAEGGGGWPMHAAAQPWHAEGQPSSTGAARQRSQGATGALAPMARAQMSCSPSMPSYSLDLRCACSHAYRPVQQIREQSAQKRSSHGHDFYG